MPRWVRRFYLSSGLGFGIWMLFFDSENLVTQYQLYQRFKQCKSDHDYYQAQINDIKEEQERLYQNDVQLEKFAREEYWMQKPGEDVYIVVD